MYPTLPHREIPDSTTRQQPYTPGGQYRREYRLDRGVAHAAHVHREKVSAQARRNSQGTRIAAAIRIVPRSGQELQEYENAIVMRR